MNEKQRALKKQYLDANKRTYLLTFDEVSELFDYLDAQLTDEGCDETLRYTTAWLNEHVAAEKLHAILAEMEEMGGCCDCEILANCYEDYDL